MSTALAIPNPHDLETWGDCKLDNAIAKGHATAGAHMRNYEEIATVTGVLLRERKRRLGPRGFSPWLAEHFDGSRQTAYRYLELADEHAPICITDVTDSSPAIEVSDEPEVIDAEVVDEPAEAVDTYTAAEEDATSAISNMAEESDLEHPRGRLVLAFDRLDELKELLDRGAEVRPRTEKDRHLLLGDIERARKTLARAKHQIQKGDST